MKISAKVRHLHASPQKCRLVIDLIRGMEVKKAGYQLKNLNKKAALSVLKLLNSAVSSAEHNHGMEKDNLYISKIFADEGTKMKRWRPRAFGRAYPIIRRTSHITLVLDEKVVGKKKTSKKVSKVKKDDLKKETIREKLDQKRKDKEKKYEKRDIKENKSLKTRGVFKKMFRRKSV